MKKGIIFRLFCIFALWGIFAWWYIDRLITVRNATDKPVTLIDLFWLIASGIIVFVPLYKKYVKNDGKSNGQR